ncbi:thiamine biosynthesis sulfur transfer protein [Moraxella macacae 0408225]|uniref:Thiamine biosynthesis sulfur transfer protein n=1 Tax=Moraxella macacae 0408225 TaxID=1230338 RepID=L2F6C9_9GAMM|nr:sulfur carrier protein ThiS [Moraxella macacae]ELA08351.1 thiamine biosynthesis sulfur transfer protein [Moraxella macacae 0408225]
MPTEQLKTEQLKTVQLNGETLQTSHDNLLLFLDDMGQTNGRFAVEINGELIPKSQLNLTSLHDNMVIEVVQAVGGG